MMDLGAFGRTTSYARSVNQQGQVVGATYDTPNVQESGFLYSSASTTILGTLGGSRTEALGLNNGGTIVGSSSLPNGAVTPFIADGSGMRNLGSFGGSGGQAWAINTSGVAVGYAYLPGDNSYHAFVHNGSSLVDLNVVSSVNSDARDINDQGKVVGYTSSSAGSAQAVMWDASSVHELGSIVGLANSVALSINSGDVIVGYAHETYSNPLDTGLFSYAASDRAFLYEDGQMHNLTELLSKGSGWILSRATDVNSLGQIFGYGLNPQGQISAFLLTPVPEPSSYVLFGAGFALILTRMRRQAQTTSQRSVDA